MTQEEQKAIFSRNLKHYMSLAGKQQIDVAKDLQIKATTLNSWCKGVSIPEPSKIRKLADYFGIGKSDLLDEKLDSDPMLDARILSDVETVEMIRKFYSLSVEDRRAVKYIIERLYEKNKSGA